MTTYKTIIGAAAVADGLNQGEQPKSLQLLDCRAALGDHGWGAQAFEEAHIAGAQRLDLEVDLAGAPLTAPLSSDDRPGGRHPLPDPDRLVSRLRQLGVSDDQQLVVYDGRDGAFAARAWWCLRWLGHARVAVLDGGLEAFTAIAENLIAAGPAVQTAIGSFSRRPALTRSASVTEVAALVEAPQPDQALIDARAEPRFNGDAEPIDPVAGHIPGAICRPYTSNLQADGHFLPAAELAKAFAAMPAERICYCGSGVTAAHNILAAVHAGQPEPALYAGSWSDWIRDPDRPCEPPRGSAGAANA